MENLALVLVSQGNYEEAEELHRETLNIRQKVRGKEHLERLTRMEFGDGAGQSGQLRGGRKAVPTSVEAKTEDSGQGALRHTDEHEKLIWRPYQKNKPRKLQSLSVKTFGSAE